MRRSSAKVVRQGFVHERLHIREKGSVYVEGGMDMVNPHTALLLENVA